MNPYDNLAKALSALRSASGGSDSERNATAALVFALIHFRLVALVQALKREDVEVTLREDASDVSVIIEGRHVRVTRFSNQAEILVECSGFDSQVIPWDKCRLRHEIDAMPMERCVHAATNAVNAIGDACRHDIAVRQVR